jgi:hypothetical protein
MAAGAADDIRGASAAIKQPPIRNIFALFMFCLPFRPVLGLCPARPKLRDEIPCARDFFYFDSWGIFSLNIQSFTWETRAEMA